MSKTRQDVFITHAAGIANVKVKDLDPETMQQLGYEAEKPEDASATTIFPQNLELDPKVREAQEQVVKEVQVAFKKAAPKVIAAFLGGLILFHFFFSYCCMLICRKAGQEPGLLAWMPVLQFFPLIKAAGMSGWWFVILFLPIINLFAIIAWCVKIVQARQKGIWVTIMLLLPITSFLAFLYLAFSDGNEEEGAPGEPSGKLVYQR